MSHRNFVRLVFLAALVSWSTALPVIGFGGLLSTGCVMKHNNSGLTISCDLTPSRLEKAVTPDISALPRLKRSVASDVSGTAKEAANAWSWLRSGVVSAYNKIATIIGLL